MRAPINRILRNIVQGCLIGILSGLLWHVTAFAAIASVDRIDLDTDAGSLRIDLSQRAMFKVLQLDAREIMVAFKPANLARNAAGIRSGSGLVKQVTLETLPDRVVSLTIDTAADIREVRADWQGSSATLLVRLLQAETAPATIPVKRRKFKKSTPVKGGVGIASTEADHSQEPSPNSPPEPLQGPVPTVNAAVQAPPQLPEPTSEDPVPAAKEAQQAAPRKEAGLDDFIPEMARSACASSPVVADVLALCKKNEWKKAFGFLGAKLDPTGSGACQADLYYLKALAAFKMNTAGSERLYLDAVNYFQDALSYYPDTPYAPFAMLALATIYNELDSDTEAMGYFNLILKTYADHPVAADALLSLGKLYVKEQKQEPAVNTFRQYIKEYPQSPRLTEVRLLLGKSLYELGEYKDSLDLLNRVVEENPRSVYEDPDLLVYIGNLNYQLGKLSNAREALAKAVNLYPDSDKVPVLLTRIGDILKDSGRNEQARKIYERVMKMYPDTDGFAISAIRCADLLSDRSKKEALYRTVIDRFSGHPIANLAVIRLADLQSQAGEYAAGIETLRTIISGDLKELQDEAEYVMASCFEGFFRQLSGQNDPLAVIAAYEKDKTLINRFENPDIFETVGSAFFQTKLYSQAEELLQKAYEASSPDTRPPSLYYRLAVTLQELGKTMQAREMFSAYFEKLPDGEKNPEAYLRMGRLLADEESWESALKFIRTGLGQSGSDLQTAELLMLQADVYGGMGKAAAGPDLLIKAISLLASSPDAENGQLMKAYRSLGESYTKLSLFDKASDAFTMALKFAGESRPPALLFLLAQADMKAAHPDAARTVLSEILSSGDNFWVRMAREQLRTLEINEKMEQQEPEVGGSTEGGSATEATNDQ